MTGAPTTCMVFFFDLRRGAKIRETAVACMHVLYSIIIDTAFYHVKFCSQFSLIKRLQINNIHWYKMSIYCSGGLGCLLALIEQHLQIEFTCMGLGVHR